MVFVCVRPKIVFFHFWAEHFFESMTDYEKFCEKVGKIIKL